MKLKDYIKQVIEACPDLSVGITFEVGLDSDGKTVNDQSLNRIKFSIKSK